MKVLFLPIILNVISPFSCFSRKAQSSQSLNPSLKILYPVPKAAALVKFKNIPLSHVKEISNTYISIFNIKINSKM